MAYGTPTIGGLAEFRVMLSAPDGAAVDATMYITVNSGGAEARDAIFQDLVNILNATTAYNVTYALRKADHQTECTPE